jgi:tRNA A-37 threonylcarbamoyl transferase component Bud32
MEHVAPGDPPAEPVEDAKELTMGDRLGRGPAGTCYSAHLRDEEVVVKILSRKFAKHENLYTEILGQLRAAVAIEANDSVIQWIELREAGSDKKARDLLIQRLAPGRTLRAYLDEKKRVPSSRALEIMAGLVDGLKAAHAAGVFHGDIRPEKIYIDDSNRVRVADFGLYKASCLGAGLGKIGLPFGHYTYLAPEVVQERKTEPTAMTDIYALGILLYEVLTGVPPYPGDDPKTVLKAHLTEPIPQPPKGVTLRKKVAKLLKRMTAKDPGRRVPTMAAMAKAVKNAMEITVTGGLHVAEFDPGRISGEKALSRDEWSMQSVVSARPAEGWNKKRITNRDQVGPADFAVTASVVPGTLRRNLKVSANMRALPAAPPTPAPRRATAKKGKGVDLNQLALALAGLLGLIVVIFAAVWLGKDEPDDVTRPPTPKTPTGPPLDSRAQKLKDVLDAYDARVDELIAQNGFAAALEAHETIDPALRQDRKVRRAVQRQTKAIKRAASAKLEAGEATVRELAKAGKTSEASNLVQEIAGWSLDAARIASLRDIVESAGSGDDSERIRQLTGVAFDVKKARLSLATSLRGWSAGGKLYKGGGLELTYGSSGPLGKDLWASQGRVTTGRAPVFGNPTGLRVVAGDQRTILILDRLPLADIVDVTLEFVVTSRPTNRSQVALLVGVNQKGTTGAGSSFGVQPVIFRKERLGARGTVTFPEIPLNARLFLKLERSGGNRPRLGAKLSGDQFTHRGAALKLDDPDALRGRVGIVVDHAEIWIVGLTVRGLFDAEAVR